MCSTRGNLHGSHYSHSSFVECVASSRTKEKSLRDGYLSTRNIVVLSCEHEQHVEAREGKPTDKNLAIKGQVFLKTTTHPFSAQQQGGDPCLLACLLHSLRGHQPVRSQFGFLQIVVQPELVQQVRLQLRGR